MKFKIKAHRRILVAMALFILAGPATGYCLSNENIFAWVAAQMDIQVAYTMPTVAFVDKASIQKVFIEGNRNGYLRWEKEYGKSKAEEILKDYLEDIVGLFNDKTRIIYVGSFMSDCRQRAVLAHEFVHYFQFVSHGPIPQGAFEEDMRRLAREMEAYKIEKEFEEAFCPQDKIPAVAIQEP